MADDGFNGSLITFGGADLGPLRDIRYSEDGANANVTGSSDNATTYEGGIPDLGVSMTIVGGVSVAKNDKGAIVITWNDGTSTPLANGIVRTVEISGSMDSEILSTVTFGPTPT